MGKFNIAILGVSGYTGYEILRLLIQRPDINIQHLIADKNAGKTIASIYPVFSDITLPQIQPLHEVDFANIHAVFCCLPHGTSQKIILDLYHKYPNLKIFDLSADFRLNNPAEYKKWYNLDHLSPIIQQTDACYGLPEIHSEKIKSKRIIACPGCYPTSIILPLYPLLKSQAILRNNIICDSKSGVSGAGRKESIDMLFCERENDVKAYSLFNHRHISEIQQELQIDDFIFTPTLVPTNRGILSTIYCKQNPTFTGEITQIWRDFYQNQPFVQICNYAPSTKEVAYTNKIRMYLQQRNDGAIIIISVIDNLCKGSSGQALQCFDLCFSTLYDNPHISMQTQSIS